MQFREGYVERLRSCLEGEEDWYRVGRCFQEGLSDDEVEDARPAARGADPAIKANPGTGASDLAKVIGVKPGQVYGLLRKAQADKLVVKDGKGYKLKS